MPFFGQHRTETRSIDSQGDFCTAVLTHIIPNFSQPESQMSSQPRDKFINSVSRPVLGSHIYLEMNLYKLASSNGKRAR